MRQTREDVLEPVSTNPLIGLSPDLTTNARSGKKLVKAAGSRDTESLCSPETTAYVPTFIKHPRPRQAWCGRNPAGCRSTRGRTCRQAEVVERRTPRYLLARSTVTRPPAFRASLLTPRRLESDRTTTFAGAPPAAKWSKALRSADGSAIPVLGGWPWH